MGGGSSGAASSLRRVPSLSGGQLFKLPEVVLHVLPHHRLGFLRIPVPDGLQQQAVVFQAVAYANGLGWRMEGAIRFS